MHINRLRSWRMSRGCLIGFLLASLSLGVAWASTESPDANTAEETVAQAALNPLPPLGGSREFGASDEPVPLGSLRPVHTVVDVKVKGSMGDFALTRHYAASTDAWRTATEPAPFGGEDVSTDSAQPAKALHWWHNLYSFVRVREPPCRRTPEGDMVCPGPYYVVRDTSGQSARFEGCEFQGFDSTCFASSNTEQQRKLARDAGGFILHTPEGRYHYRQHVGTLSFDYYFLSYVEEAQYDTNPSCLGMAPSLSDADAKAQASQCRRRVTLTYTAPSGCQGDNLQAGQLFVSKAFLGNGGQLIFNYGTRVLKTGPNTGSHECVLTSVSLLGAGSSQAEPAVQYTYSDAEDGLLTSASWPGMDKIVHYQYRMPDGRRAWIVTMHGKAGDHSDDQLISQKILHDGLRYVTEDSSPDRTYLVSADAGVCSPGDFAPVPKPGEVISSPCSTDQDQFFIASGGVPSGGGTNTRLPLEWKFHLSNTRTQGPIVNRSEVSCVSGPVKSCLGQYGIYWAWYSESLQTSSSINSDTVTVPRAERDSNGNWTNYWNELAVASDGNADVGVPRGGAFLPPAELKKVFQGATDSNGANALSVREYDYVYGGFGRGASRSFEQLVKEARVPTVVPGASGAFSQTRYAYEPFTNRLKSVIKHGWTKVYENGSWQTKERYIGTFYLTNRTCGDKTPDPMGRTLEVRGPCLVSSLSSTGCDFGGSIPVMQYEFHSAEEVGSRANRLKRKTVFSGDPGAGSECAAASNYTTYNDYDFHGNVLKVTDANGVATTYVYQGDRLQSTTSGSAIGTGLEVTIRYGYDDGTHGDYILYPDGHYEVMCFREGATASCTGGKLTAKLQWKAKAGNSYGTPWAEKVVYTYLDGALSSEAYLDSSGKTRRVRRFENDPLGRMTFEGWGTPVSYGSAKDGYALTRLYDAQGNLRGMGLPYNTGSVSLTPPPFCGGFMNNAPESRLCKAFLYDRLNRLERLVEPISEANSADTCLRYDAQSNLAGVKQGCGGSEACGACGQPETVYTHDDFGNLVEVSTPWGSDSPGQPGTFHFAYDAASNLVLKQTPEMAQSGSRIEYTYDSLGRLLKADAVSAAGADRLYSYAYDGTAPVPDNCPLPLNMKGRTQMLADSFGETWYQYDSLGRVTATYRRRAGISGGCSELNTNDTPNRRFEYLADGRLKSEAYPHGRVVMYEYHEASSGQPDRVAALKVKLWNGTAFSSEITTLISNVKWEPFGGVREYQIHAPHLPAGSNLATVEYLLGGTNTSPGTCSSSRNDVAQEPSASYDRSGRLRALWVSTGGTAGSRGGDILKRVYTWKGDQLAEEASCVLDTSATPFTKVRYSDAAGGNGYDRRTQLTHVSRPTGEFMQRGGSLGRRDYLYDARGNVSSVTQDCWTFGVSRASYPHVDLVESHYLANQICGTNICGGTPNLGRRFQYDADGRVKSIEWLYNGSRSFTRYQFSSELDGAHAAVGAVFRAVTDSQGRTYEYFYDANGRRRLKRYNGGVEDEHFYEGAQLLEDRGNVSTYPGAGYTLDEYLWLDGRPVAFLKSTFDTNWNRQSDMQGDCMRNGEPVPCGVYFLVTDYLGKPVLALDSYRRISGVADYDAFGHVNRVTAVGDSAHSYAPNSNLVLGYFQQPAGAGMQVQLRARYVGVDVRHPSAFAYLSDAYDHELTTVDGQSTRTSTANAPAAITGWVNVPGDGRVHARFRSGGEQDTSYGVSLAGYEYRRFQQGALPVWTPLRYPGQYYDAETDLVENWNRYFDPSIGRYLGPEPMAMEPSWVLEQARTGRSSPIYGYAANNPLAFTDPDGLEPDAFLAGQEALKDCGNGVIDCSDEAIEGSSAEYRETANEMLAIAAIASVGFVFEIPVVAGVMLSVLDPSELGDEAGGATAAMGPVKTVEEMGSELADEAGTNRVSARTVDGRVDIDLEGKSHFDKASGQRIPTPHVRTGDLHVGPNGKSSYTNYNVRPAKKSDMRLARKIFQRLLRRR